MKYLITGGAGFVGSHLTDALLKRGDSVVVLDNMATGVEGNLKAASTHPNFSFISGSILDTDVSRALCPVWITCCTWRRLWVYLISWISHWSHCV